MNTTLTVVAFLVGFAASATLIGQGTTTASATGSRTIRAAVIGDSNLRSNFIGSLREAALAERLKFEIVPRTEEGLEYVIVIAQETTIGSAAAAVIALDKSGDVAASVVRSGRLSGRGALNACAKELVKKLAALH